MRCFVYSKRNAVQQLSSMKATFWGHTFSRHNSLNQVAFRLCVGNTNINSPIYVVYFPTYTLGGGRRSTLVHTHTSTHGRRKLIFSAEKKNYFQTQSTARNSSTSNPTKRKKKKKIFIFTFCFSPRKTKFKEISFQTRPLPYCTSSLHFSECAWSHAPAFPCPSYHFLVIALAISSSPTPRRPSILLNTAWALIKESSSKDDGAVLGERE